ncbi:MAG TPA: hypothetical protein VIR27_19950 [Mycobacteriales bacterium]|jgi:hypothetical protein
MPPRYSPTDEPPDGDVDPQHTELTGHRTSRLIVAGLIVAVAILVTGSLRGRRR